MRLKDRLRTIERQTGINHIHHWVRVVQLPGQDQAEAIRAHEASSGPIGNSGIILRVFI